MQGGSHKMKSFTRGGQVTLHNLRMMRQVLNATVLVTLIAGVSFWGTKSWHDCTSYERSSALSYYLAYVKVNFPLVRDDQKRKMTQFYTFADGRKQRAYSLDILNDPWHQLLVKNIHSRLVDNAFLALLCMGGMFLVISGFWVWRGRAKKAKEILSGLKVVKPHVLKKMLKSDASTFHIAGIPLRKDSETQHLLVCGTTGTGKSTCFFELLPQIRAEKQRAIIIDTTGEFVARYYRDGRDILINPFDDRTLGWNPWVDCVSPYHYDEVASAFIPQTGGDKFWSDAARTVFSETLKLHQEQGNYNTDYMLHMLLTVPLKELFRYLGTTSAASLVDPAGDRTAMSIRAHLSSYLKFLVFLPKGRPIFSIRKWVQEGSDRALESQKEQTNTQDQWVFLMGTPDQRETLRPFLTALTGSAVNALMGCKPDRDRRLWFIIDELASLHKQEALPKALGEIRKYGGCIAVGLQDIPQLQAQYGRAEAESLVSLLNTRVIFRNGHPDTARVMSQMLGEQEVREAVEGISYGANTIRDGVSLNDQNKMKPAVTPTDLMALENREAYLKLPGNLPVAKIKFGVPSSELICPAFIPIADDKPHSLEAEVDASEVPIPEARVPQTLVPETLASKVPMSERG
jgi:type IV conjugative transfer system coupling protein TraD